MRRIAEGYEGAEGERVAVGRKKRGGRQGENGEGGIGRQGGDRSSERRQAEQMLRFEKRGARG